MRIFLTVLLVSITSIHSAFAQDGPLTLEQIDTDRDGYASPTERQAYFKKLTAVEQRQPMNDGKSAKQSAPQYTIDPRDLNKDGIVTRNEDARYRAALPSSATKRQTAQPRKNIALPDDRKLTAVERRNLNVRASEMKSLDVNGDGIIQAGELKKAPIAKFNALDTDRDGILSQGEMSAALPSTKTPNDENAAFAKQRAGRLKNSYKTADKDKSGSVSKSEYEAYLGQRQANFDRDQNGVISIDEYRATSERLPSYYGRSGTD